MAGILDIRRRIRSVRNTRQITRAMKMISAARLRRAQDRALSGRPYAQMLTNVLKSLVMRAEIYDPETGEPRHPLLAQRPENTILLIVVTGDKGLAGAFNANILKVAQRVVVDEVLPVVQIGASGVRQAEEFAEQEKLRMAEAARSAGVTLTETETREIDERAAAFAAAPVDYIYEQPPEELFRSMLP